MQLSKEQLDLLGQQAVATVRKALHDAYGEGHGVAVSWGRAMGRSPWSTADGRWQLTVRCGYSDTAVYPVRKDGSINLQRATEKALEMAAQRQACIKRHQDQEAAEDATTRRIAQWLEDHGVAPQRRQDGVAMGYQRHGVVTISCVANAVTITVSSVPTTAPGVPVGRVSTSWYSVGMDDAELVLRHLLDTRMLVPEQEQEKEGQTNE